MQAYPVTGKTGAELYASIGERGPKAGIGRAIAFTNFKLTWTRKYEPQGKCLCSDRRAAKAHHNLYAAKACRAPAGICPKKVGNTFISGVRQHERVHGDLIKDMVKKIEAVSVGLTAADDPQCQKIRADLTARLGELSRAQRQQSRDFDRAELSNGGNVHQLVLALVNGQ